MLLRIAEERVYFASGCETSHAFVFQDKTLEELLAELSMEDSKPSAGGGAAASSADGGGEGEEGGAEGAGGDNAGDEEVSE